MSFFILFDTRDVSVSNQTGRRLDTISRLETLGTFYTRIRVFKRIGSCFSISEIVCFVFLPFLSRMRDWPWRVKRIEMILIDKWKYRLFHATLAAEIFPLSVPNCWILQMIGQSSSDVALSRPTRNLASHGAVTKDATYLVVVPWGCIDGRLCECVLTNRFRRLLGAASGYRRALNAETWRRGVLWT